MASLIEQISKNAPASTSWLGFAEPVMLGIGAANLPLGLFLWVGVAARDVVAEHKSQAETPMSDEWLRQVSESPEVSRKGLAHLGKCLHRQGFVSVKDALEWARIEEKEVEKAAARSDRREKLESEGAKALLNRAKRECPTLFDLDVNKALEGIRARGNSVIDYTAGFASRFRQDQDK